VVQCSDINCIKIFPPHPFLLAALYCEVTFVQKLCNIKILSMAVSVCLPVSPFHRWSFFNVSLFSSG